MDRDPTPSGPADARPDPESPEELYEGAPCALISSRLDRTITRVNRTFETWSGYRRDEVVGHKRLTDVLAAGDRIYYETHYAPLLAMQGEVRAIAVEVVAADGRTLPALIGSTVVRDAAGAPVGVRTALFDARDRRAYERELLAEKRRAESSEARARLLAQTLQASLMPPIPPAIPGFDVAAAYRPAGQGDEVGGDFYDVFGTPGAGWAVVLGDVTGKGASAAVVTALARYTIRAAVMQSTEPASVLRMLNAALLRSDDARPVTAVYAAVEGEGRGTAEVVVSTAGNPLPRLLRDGHVSAVGVPGMILGFRDDPPLHEERLRMRPGDILVMFTDGITDARRGRAEWFGEERLDEELRSLAESPASEIARTLVEGALAFQNGDAYDDIALVVLRYP